MDVKYSEIGTEVEVGKIDGHQKRIKAKVVRFPFYDPDKTRVKHASPPPIARSVYCAQIDMSSAIVFDKNWLRPKDRLAKKRKPIAIHRPSDELESC